MLQFIRRTFEKLSTRSLEAAGSGPRWQTQRRALNINAEVAAGASLAAGRASWFARNNPNVAAGISSLVANAVGCGIKPRSRHPDPRVRDALHRLWERWERDADASGQPGGFYHLQSLAVRAMIEEGESFAILHTRGDGDGLPVPFQVELVSREQIPLSPWQDMRPGTLIRAGIEFDRGGRRVAFWVLPFNPSDPTAALVLNTWVPERVPADEVLHLFQPVAAGQVRGLSWLTPVLLRLRELDQYEDAALVRAKVSALLMGFVVNRDGDNPAWGGQAGAPTPTLEPGTLAPLNPGEGVEFTNPPQDQNYHEFVKGHLKAIAAGIGVQYHQMSGDLSEANYSSLRAGLVEFRRKVEQLQHLVIIPRFCDPVWRRFVTLAVMSGAIDAPDFFTRPEEYLACDWLPPAWEWVDPLKDQQAEVLAITNGLKSRSMVVAEAGYDAEDIDRQIAADQTRAKALGITLAGPAASPAPEAPANV